LSTDGETAAKACDEHNFLHNAIDFLRVNNRGIIKKIVIEWPAEELKPSPAEGMFIVGKQQVSITVDLISDKTLNV
jgi:hypothetical protein